MQTRLTTWDATVLLANKAGITTDQAKAVLQAQAELAYQHAESGYPIAGIGILSKIDRPERKMVMRFGPKKGEEVTIPSRKKLKFLIARAAKDVVLGHLPQAPDVSQVEVIADDEPPDEGA